jgi:hypothetical protein
MTYNAAILTVNPPLIEQNRYVHKKLLTKLSFEEGVTDLFFPQKEFDWEYIRLVVRIGLFKVHICNNDNVPEDLKEYIDKEMPLVYEE